MTIHPLVVDYGIYCRLLNKQKITTPSVSPPQTAIHSSEGDSWCRVPVRPLVFWEPHDGMLSHAPSLLSLSPHWSQGCPAHWCTLSLCVCVCVCVRVIKMAKEKVLQVCV